MKNSILIIFSLLAFSCTQITITHDNETRLIEKAIQIDSAKFNFLKDTFNLAEIDNNNNNNNNLFISSLKPKHPITLGIKEIVNDNCLVYFGCLFSESVCVIIKECSKYHILNNQEDLKTYFAPINSAEEALSYAPASASL
ncbi:hypothetical protein L3049_18740 [Labilibaculum sp. DW002]|uniref:Lipoprotein n=1 Tax=Paralabilibaculum antarcticum TaxID=2912572 RepID=A0ABT5VXJ2_9BACT|nr:hypothetical protein [Labilibaculum sp. DW002]MDE5420032.1 hypothetical protein [Labilibaculum sp. DW002]